MKMSIRVLSLGNINKNQKVASSLEGTPIDFVPMTNHSEACTTLNQEKFDLFLLDAAIPDYEEVCRQISSQHNLPVALLYQTEGADWKKYRSLDAQGFIPEESNKDELLAQLKSISRPSKAQSRRIKLLVIEDDEPIKETLSLTFHIYWPNIDVVFTGSGQDGIDLAGKTKFDAIILDIILPDKPGLEVLTALKSISQAPVIILTADHSKDTQLKASNMGAADYILKPFKLNDLITKLKNIFRGAENSNQFIVGN
jgi:DNA-binding response OmpR family regulator